jgi:hypothetical protein
MYPIAQEFTALGYAVIPIHYRTKEAKVKWAPYQECLPSKNNIFKWFAHTITNGAVLTGCHGHGRGLVVIDFDNMPDFLTWYKWAGEANEISRSALDAYMVKTSRGVHVYLTSEQAHTFRNLHYGGVDIKGESGYIMLPGSVHPSGFVYQAVDENNWQFPVFESLDQVLPPEILERRESAVFLAPALPSYTEPNPLQILDQPAGKKMTIAQIKSRHKIEDFIPLSMRSGANYYVAKCPFHADQHDSMWVDTNKQICGCYAGCSGQTPWDIINLFARLRNVSNNEAIEILSKM